ncbi:MULTISPECIES: L-2-hydroxyglutarate oxidase [unclassified Streptomyces]|uniref:L-2-hydroxyglutarate oxidase n=1 Tax=unclassified Streptomyces TaxID=2593676 RepID=UPI00036FB75C|nr:MULTISPECIES: L-2-hydroxyglutarate oxidase [unclassified Streptomyces]
MDTADIVVIGAGIVGLATAYAITRTSPGTSVLVLDKEDGPARHQTGHNSGVIHSGVYYRPGSLKARYATQGAAEMVKFCAGNDIPHDVTGKLIVATEREELPRLHALVQRGRQNDIPVQELGPAQITEREPHVRGLAAIHVGTTGVCDFTAVAAAMARLTTEGGRGEARIAYGREVRALHRDGRSVIVEPHSGPPVRAGALVNCAGLYCDRVARMAGTANEDVAGVRIVPFRGEYHELRPDRAGLVRGLVYPVPDPAFPFLGVHLTRSVDGSVHVGPNAVPALAREGYRRRTVHPRDLVETAAFPGTWRIALRQWRYEAGEIRRSLSKRAFVESVQRLLPEVTADDLVPAAAGVRAQAVLRDGTLVDDFLIAGDGPFVHVLNAPSPAATASLPIGREIARRALAVLGRT